MTRRKRTRWKTTAIPADLYSEIERISREHGYTSIIDFVKDACRRRVEELQSKVQEVAA
jgi:metal-responsive CopG/Arc/MetJ family transcriptional regulator